MNNIPDSEFSQSTRNIWRKQTGGSQRKLDCVLIIETIVEFYRAAVHSCADIIISLRACGKHGPTWLVSLIILRNSLIIPDQMRYKNINLFSLHKKSKYSTTDCRRLMNAETLIYTN